MNFVNTIKDDLVFACYVAAASCNRLKELFRQLRTSNTAVASEVASNGDL